MNNINSLENKFILSWEKFLFEGKTLSQLEEKDKIKYLQKYKDSVQKLWKMFNLNRAELLKTYMFDKGLLNGYMAAFWWPNVYRTLHVLNNNYSNVNWQKWVNDSAGEINIIDFGSGPLSATVGFLLSLMEKTNKKIIVHAVERSQIAVDLGINILKSADIDNENIQVIWYTSAIKIQQKCDIILAANVFNEIPEKHRYITFLSLWEKLREDGIFCIIEPGQENHSKSLSLLRNNIIEKKEVNCSIIAPCLSNHLCPLTGAKQTRDWCWFNFSWDMPKVLKFFDNYTHLQHNLLALSFLFLRKNSIHKKRLNNEHLLNNDYGIIISDHIYIKAEKQMDFFKWAKYNVIRNEHKFLEPKEYKNLTKILICSNKNKLTSIIFEESEQMAHFLRGKIIKEIEMEKFIEIKEMER